MSNEQPLVSVGNNNRIGSHNTLIIAFIPTLIFTGLVAYAIWPVLWIIPYVLGGILTLVALYFCGVGITDLRRRWFHALILETPEYGHTHLGKWEHLPALPAPSVQVSEVKDDPPVDRVKQALDILEVNSHGTGIESIAKSYKDAGDTYWTPWRVRQVVQGRKK